ncbi:MAG: DNA-formamidopyrimidine glycosylase [Bacilli bacterium]|nr:DNA-formamidopyrimidine glycosylase [Bacilli bacterium]
MPELPEVETIKNVLKPIVINKKIIKIDVLRDSTIVGDTNLFVSSLTNQTFLDVTRIGKYLIFHLTNGLVFLSHLRMEGKYFELDEKESNTKHTRVVFHLNNSKKLIYDDSRCFGILKLSSENNYLNEKEIKVLGPEPFDIENGTYLHEKAKKVKLPIKTFLLDQSVMTGLGNIYVDETLFKSKIHPLTPVDFLSKKDFDTILFHAKETLKEAIISGGSTIKSYHPSKDIDGKFQTKLLAYGKKGTACPSCGATFRFTKVNGRGTTYCPNCQMVRKSQIVVGITGKIASGKSSVAALFKENSIPTFSSDEIVLDLYKNKNVIAKINKAFNLTFSDVVDKTVLRKYLLDNPKDINKLNKIVHPLVKEEIIRQIAQHKKGIIVFEVPLLFEANFEYLFDYIIAVDVNKKEQEKRLALRNPLSHLDLKIINSNNKFEIYKKMVDIIIENDKDIDHLKDIVNKIINKLRSRLN